MVSTDALCAGASRSDTSATQAPQCSGLTPHGRLLYFGGDAVRSITVLITPSPTTTTEPLTARPEQRRWSIPVAVPLDT